MGWVPTHAVPSHQSISPSHIVKSFTLSPSKRVMTNYRRMRVDGGTYFFTVALANRRVSTLEDHTDVLRETCRMVLQSRPVTIDAMVALPDHFHAGGTLSG